MKMLSQESYEYKYESILNGDQDVEFHLESIIIIIFFFIYLKKKLHFISFFIYFCYFLFILLPWWY